MITRIEVERANLASARITTLAEPELAEGEVLAHVDRFALTANNVTYGVAGDSFGYWTFFPAEAGWGVIPVWGFATVTRSRCAEVEEGARFWGFLPMASHLVLSPAQVRRSGFVDAAAHRVGLPEVYNRYAFTAGDPPELAALEAERCALFPLFNTAFLICDFLADNQWFGARQVVVLSASSKTGLGLANLLARVEGRPVRVVGVTSPGNRGFVEGLGSCDQVLAYEDIEQLDPSVPTIVVDMAGSADALRAVHTRFGANLVHSCQVGMTHWREGGPAGDLPGASPTLFFAPSQIVKREADWGPGVLGRRAAAEQVRIAGEIAGRIRVEPVVGPEPCRDILADLMAGRVTPDRILMLTVA